MVEDGVLEYVAGDLLVHVASFTQGIVLTHRLGEAELVLGALHAAFDLAGLSRLDELTLAGGGVAEAVSVKEGHLAWHGPEGWLKGFAAGDVDTLPHRTPRRDLQPLRHGAGPDRQPVTDAHLAALAVEHGLELFSNDSNFARFSDLRWRNPLAR